jgi:hypothetical protein
MKTTTKLSLVAIFAAGLLATMGSGAAQAAKPQHQATACTAQPGDLDALFCAPAPAAAPPHHPHGKK